MIIIAYFFLLRPGDNTGFKLYSTTFQLEDISFICGRSVFGETATEAELQAAIFMALNFSTQKNGVRGKNIGHKASWDPLLCKNSSLLRRVLHFRANKATSSNPLARVMTLTWWWEYITPKMISNNLKFTIIFCGPNLGFESKDVSACSLCTAGTMALLCARVDRDIINLIDRWRSNKILHCLHVQE